MCVRERKEEEKEVRGEHDGKKVEPLKKAFDSPLAFFESRWWSWWWWCCIQQLGELLGEHGTFIHKISGHACYLARHSTAWYAKIPIALYCTVTFFFISFPLSRPLSSSCCANLPIRRCWVCVTIIDRRLSPGRARHTTICPVSDPASWMFLISFFVNCLYYYSASDGCRPDWRK